MPSAMIYAKGPRAAGPTLRSLSASTPWKHCTHRRMASPYSPCSWALLQGGQNREFENKDICRFSSLHIRVHWYAIKREIKRAHCSLIMRERALT